MVWYDDVRMIWHDMVLICDMVSVTAVSGVLPEQMHLFEVPDTRGLLVLVQQRSDAGTLGTVLVRVSTYLSFKM